MFAGIFDFEGTGNLEMEVCYRLLGKISGIIKILNI